MSTARRLIAVVAMALVAPGCLPFTEPSEGELGRVEYAWSEGFLGCLFGCDASAPLAVEGHALLTILDREDLPPFTVSSDDPEVALFTQDGVSESAVRTEGVSPGRARIILRDARTGDVVDRLPIRVGEVDRIEPGRDLPNDSLTLMVGAEYHLRLRLFDGDREMVGVGAVEYELTSDLGTPAPTDDFLGLDGIFDGLASFFSGQNHESVDLEAREQSTGALRVVAASGAALELPYEVVVAADITDIELSVDYAEDEDDSTRVEAVAFVGDREVIRPLCEWTISPEAGPVGFYLTSAYYATMESSGPGSAVVTCTIGSVSESVTVSF